MCCFSTKTEVHATRIFARMTGPDTQVLVYQMQYSAAEPTAMILPLPVALPAGEASVRWRNLKEYATFFSDLAAGFPAKPEWSLGLFRSKAAGTEAVVIPVHDVGDFV